jgi:hypothetical protein
MSASPLPSANSATDESGHRRYLALVVGSVSAMLAGLAVGYALGTVHAYERRLGAGTSNGGPRRGQ